MDEPLFRTALYDWHAAHGGRLGPFAGWELPIRYEAGTLEEHRTVRRSAGLFDIDHMGQFTVAGPDAGAWLNTLVTRDLSVLNPGQSSYALLCHEGGGVIDDLFIYRRPQDWFVVVNASNRRTDWEWFMTRLPAQGVVLTDVSDPTYMVALQGPRALDLLAGVCSFDPRGLERFGAAEGLVAGVKTLVGRTGYTGEDGVELFFPAPRAVEVWTTLLDHGTRTGIEVKPIGLGARDSLRFEPGFPLHGHEISPDITPLEAGLGWACDLNKAFVGREALVRQKAEGLTQKLVTFELTEAGVPREGYEVVDGAGAPVGRVVTGLYAPTLDKTCGHAFVPPALAVPGTPLGVVIRGQTKAAVVVRRPLYKPAYRT